MKPVTATVLTALLSFGLGLYLPWWTVAVAAGLVALVLDVRPLAAFLCGFGGVFLLWGALAWLRSTGNDHILAHRMSEFILKQDNPRLLVLLTALSGGLTAGLGGLTGSLFRRLKKEPRA
jgi:hypothetical protein